MQSPPLQAAEPNPAPILEYDQARGGPSIPPRWRRAIYLLAMLPAAVVPFVSFTYDVSPFAVAQNFFGYLWQGKADEQMLLILIAAPFFLGLPIVLRALRLLIRAPDTAAERILALCLAVAAALMTLSFFSYGIYHNSSNPLNDKEVQIVAGGPAVILAGGLLIVGLARLQPKSHTIIPTALHVAYLANAWICLIEFANDRGPGWWLTLISAAAMLLHVCFVFAGLMLRMWRRN